MTLKKRGLGRGLEALLADVPVKEHASNGVEGRVVSGEAQEFRIASQVRREQSSFSADETTSIDQANMETALLDDSRLERLNLLEEAEALKELIDEFELIVRGDMAQD